MAIVNQWNPGDPISFNAGVGGGSAASSWAPQTPQAGVIQPPKMGTAAPSGAATQAATSAVSAQNPFQAQWNTNVTAPLYGGGETSFSSPGSPNVNYPSQATAQAVANMFGGSLMTQRMDNLMGGAPSAPMYGIDFGMGDPVNAGQVAFWLQRGDSQDEIRRRIAAGVAPPLGVAQRPSNEAQGAWANDFTNNSPKWLTNALGGGASSAPMPSPAPSGIPQTPSFYNQPQASTAGSAATNQTSAAQPQAALLQALLGNNNLSGILSLLANLGYFSNGAQRRPALTGTARNGALTRSYYYPQYEPVY